MKGVSIIEACLEDLDKVRILDPCKTGNSRVQCFYPFINVLCSLTTSREKSRVRRVTRTTSRIEWTVLAPRTTACLQREDASLGSHTSTCSF